MTSIIANSQSFMSQPKVLQKAVLKIDSSALRKSFVWAEYADRFRNMVTMKWHGAARKQAKGITAPSSFHEHSKLQMSDNVEVYFDGSLTMMIIRSDDDESLYMLTDADLDRIQQMCMSRAMLEVHQATYPMTAGNNLADYVALKNPVMKIFHTALEKADSLSCNYVCQNMRKAFNTYLSYAAGPLSDIGTQILEQENAIEGYAKGWDYSKYMSLMKNSPFDLAQDLGRIYKLLPAPDYDIGESFAARCKEHLNPNPAIPITDGVPANMQDFKLYLRKFMIQTLIKANKNKGVGTYRTAFQPTWWEDYVKNGEMPAGLTWVNDIELRGSQKYKERMEDNLDMWKDTAVAEDTLDEMLEMDEMSRVKRNMLLRYLYDDSCPSIITARKKFSRSDHCHRVGHKMEAHKPVARLFFIGNMLDRHIQSEMEENIHRIAVHAPGYMIGQTTEYTANKIMKMVAPAIDPDQVVLYLNFDLKRWSPGMRAEIQRLSHEIWGEVFDRPEFVHAYKINEQSTVVLSKRGYEAMYVNPGANFEGYNGKEMTFMHCAMMGYAVYRHNLKHEEHLKIQLCAFIDDGLASLTLKRDGASDKFMKFYEAVDETYKALGFVIERSKCYLSDRFAIFLNEIYYYGRHITYGLRAIMRIGTTQKEAYETTLDEINKHASGAQGAMKAGLDGIASYATFLWCVSRILTDAVLHKAMDPFAAVLFAYSPKCFLGLQIPTYMAIASNYVADSLSEAIAILQYIAQIYPGAADSVVNILRRNIEAKSEIGTLLSPLSVHAFKVAMVENRIQVEVSKALRKAELSRKAKELVRLVDDADLAALADAIVSPNQLLPEVILTLAYDSTPTSIMDSFVAKFESSTTVTHVVGRNTVRKIAEENRRDFERVAYYFRHT